MTVIIMLYNNDGTIAKRRKGPTSRHLERAHQNGTCHAFCAHCVTEFEEMQKAKTDLHPKPRNINY
jgi:hypothetical protein